MKKDMRRSRLFLLAAGAALAFAAAVCVGCKQEEEEEPWDAMVIEDGVLVRWRGAEGDVAIPNGVTSIGKEAFKDSWRLKSVTIPAGVTSIGKSAFYKCTALQSVAIPADSKMTDIGDGAFEQCTSLASVTIPTGVTSIGDEVFSGCTSLASVTIPAGVTSIGDEAFSGCTSLASITIPSDVTSIGKSAFYGCEALQNVAIPDGSKMTDIGDGAFEQCTSLVSVTIPAGVTSIGDAAFSGCTSLASVTIPAGVTSIGKSAFYKCTALQSVAIPDGSKMTDIGGSAFAGCTSLASVTIPAGVTSIGGSAFGGCTSLAIITIPADVTSIGDYAFSGCSGLKEATVLGGAVGYGAFYNCNSLERMTVGSGVTSFNTLFTLPIHPIDVYICDVAAWCGIDFDTWLPSSWKFHIGDEEDEIARLEIPEGVVEIKKYAFHDFSALTSVSIPASVKHIGDRAFCGGKTKTIDYKGTLSEWCAISFDSALQLSAYTFDSTYLNIEGGGINLDPMTIPGDVKEINDYAFCGVSTINGTTIKSLNIEDGVERIGACAFGGFNLFNVAIPKSVASIGSGAFTSQKFRVINFNGTMAEWEAITKGGNWNRYIFSLTVQCTDGSLDQSYSI